MNFRPRNLIMLCVILCDYLCAFISFHSFVISKLCYREYKIIKAYVLIDKCSRHYG